MTAQIIPFPLPIEREVLCITGTNDFNELLQLRSHLVDKLFELMDQGDEKSRYVLSEVGGQPLMEQMVMLYRHYPDWEEWQWFQTTKGKIKKR